MRKVDLRMNEQLKYDVVKRAASKEISTLRAAVLLNCTQRSVYNLINRYRLRGKLGFVHGNRGRAPSTQLTTSLRQRIVSLYSSEKYQDANFKHFLELLRKQDIYLSYFTLYHLLRTEGFLSPMCYRRTKIVYNKQLKQKLQEKETLSSQEIHHIATTNLEESFVKHHPRKPRAKYFGELLQVDASEHVWFGETKSFLHLAIDDATGRVLGAYFALQETLLGYYNVFYQILSTHGIPAKFLTDNRAVFEARKKKNPSDEKDLHTQFGYACHLLGVEIITSSTPQVKGRIERLFRTLQSRLITELKIANITTLEAANGFLTSYFTAFNQQFAVPLHYTLSVFDTPIDLEKINYCLSIVTKRFFDRGNCIKFQNQYYQPYEDQQMVCFPQKTIGYVMQTFDQQMIISVHQRVYFLRKLEAHKKYSKSFDMEEEKKLNYTGHKPASCHPWTYETFKAKRRKKIA